MRVLTTITSAALLATGIAVSAPASATDLTTFATFSPIGTAKNMRWEKVGTAGGKLYTTATGTSNVPGSVNVKFTFLDPALNTYINGLTAKFTFLSSVSGSPAVVSGTNIAQNIGSGSFSFVTTAPITIGSTTYATGSNLLSGSFNTATFSGTVGGSSGSVETSTDGGAVLSFTSDFMSFANSTSRDYSFGLTAIASVLAQASKNDSLRTFRATASGNFSVAAVPEPASWAMMIGGLGLVGLMARRRKLHHVAA